MARYAHEVQPGDLIVAAFPDRNGVRRVEHVPGPYTADPHPVTACGCTRCDECDEIDRDLARYLRLAPGDEEEGEDCGNVLRHCPAAIVPAAGVQAAKAACAEQSNDGPDLDEMGTDDLHAAMADAVQELPADHPLRRTWDRLNRVLTDAGPQRLPAPWAAPGMAESR